VIRQSLEAGLVDELTIIAPEIPAAALLRGSRRLS
jgi:hypothetical protein